MGKKISMLLVIMGLLVASYKSYKFFKYQKESVPEAVSISQILKEKEIISENDDLYLNSQNLKGDIINVSILPQQLNEQKFPEELNLQLVFYPQAPFGNWNLPWQEACEEASVLLVANEYLNKNWSREEFNAQILALVDFQNKRFGDYKHTTVAQTATILEEYFGLKTIIHQDPNFEKVQEILNNGHLIIMTFAGKKIGNPFYKNGGPIYHAMVIKGYKKGEKLITHDVGTKRGEDYVYKWKILYNAMHDYDQPIEKGEKKMIEVLP